MHGFWLLTSTPIQISKELANTKRYVASILLSHVPLEYTRSFHTHWRGSLGTLTRFRTHGRMSIAVPHNIQLYTVVSQDQPDHAWIHLMPTCSVYFDVLPCGSFQACRIVDNRLKVSSGSELIAVRQDVH